MEHFTWEWQIPVTQEDIDKGGPGNCRTCPIARAARRHPATKPYRLTVSAGINLYVGINKALRWAFSDEANEFIVDFDSPGRYGTICRTRVQPTTLSFFLEQ